MRKIVFMTLAAGLVATVGASGCYYDLNFYPACYDEKVKEWDCCDPEYTPPDHPVCTGDAGADAEADASENGGEADAGVEDGGPDADTDDGGADASANDGGPPSAVCHGSCTPAGGGGFDPFPSYVWFEEEGKLPPEPLDGAPWTSWIGVEFAEPNCPTCSCVAPKESSDGCVLPAVWSAESTTCQDPSSPSVTPFDPPVNWAGSCTSADPIEAGLLCDGEPCVKSLVVKPPSIAPCVADPAMPPEGQTLPPPKQRLVMGYVAVATGGACDGDGIKHCIAPPPDGYKSCFVARNADAVEPCPKGWTDRYEGWRDVVDTRACTPCTCGSPEGGHCEVRAKVFADDTCGDERASVVLPSNEGAKCVDLPIGTALGSQTAEVLSYQPGSCVASMSEIVGEAKTERAVTYCCAPETDVPK